MKKSEMNSPNAAVESANITMNILSKRKQQNLAKNEGGEIAAEETLRRESTPEVEIICQVESTKTSIHDLPSEMLMKILGTLDFQSLLHCRLMSRNWTRTASEICRSRSDLCIQFDCFNEDRKLVIMHKMRNTSLAEFTELFGSSANFPFAHFHFHGVISTMFHKTEWTKFLSVFKEKIKGLKLSNDWIHKVKSVTRLMNPLRRLLLNQLPKLQEFGLQLVKFDRLNSKEIRLFPKSAVGFDSPTPTTSTGKGKEKDERTQLVHLKVVYLDALMFFSYKGIVTDLLLAAVKLVKVEPFKPGDCYRSVITFRFLESLGKLGCVQSTEIDLTSADDAEAPLVFKLKRLHFSMRFTENDPTISSDATIYLSNLLESHKNSLRELKMEPLGFFEGLPLPQFPKLSSLSVGNLRSSQEIKAPILPPGIQLKFIFPVLNSLELEISWKTAFPHKDFISPIPTLRRLKIVGGNVNETSIVQISSVCPHLKDFCIFNGRTGTLQNFPEVGSAIWTHLQKLQYLELVVNVQSRANAAPAIDSCITGFSEQDFQRVYDCIKADKLLRKWGFEGGVSQSEMAAERQNPSILNLKDLKKLTICLTLRDLRINDDKEDLLGKALTFVSEEHAFKLMKDLTYDIKRYSLLVPSNMKIQQPI